MPSQVKGQRARVKSEDNGLGPSLGKVDRIIGRAELDGRRALVTEPRKAQHVERGRAAVEQTDEYVHENPWQSIAIGAGVAALVGIAIGVMLADRR